jgi:phospholipid-binding lipoprotein MlaA
MKRNIVSILVAVAVALQFAGCATLPSGTPDPRDRFERANRSIYKFNSALDHAVVRPVARAYVKVTPRPVRRSVSNFLSNFEYPVTIVNDFLQGKGRDGFSDIARFGVNTVIGIGGLFDPASHWGLDKHDEDFGQTLGKWGVPSGPYLMLPLLGPSTVRDAPAKLVDRVATPDTYINDLTLTLGLGAAKIVDTRAGLLNADQMIDSAYDPYAFVRNTWLQRREFKVRDGKVPAAEEPTSDEPAPPAHEP